MEKPGAKAFIVYKSKMLLVLRDNKPDIPHPNKWNTPGGGIEEGESPEQALKRELMEEISVIPKDIYYVGKTVRPNGGWATRYVIFLTDQEYSQLKLGDEGQKMAFFTIDELLQKELPGDYKEYFSKYKMQFDKLLNDGVIPKPEEIGLEK